MTEAFSAEDWLWVMIQDPGPNETVVGMHDEKGGFSFIPMFREKDAALRCFLNLPREPGKKYEAQAMIFDDLLRYAVENGALLYLLDGDGNVSKTINPAQEA